MKNSFTLIPAIVIPYGCWMLIDGDGWIYISIAMSISWLIGYVIGRIEERSDK